MERRKAITTAAAVSFTLLAGAAGIALNSGIVGAGGDGIVGQISPVDATTNPPITVYVDDPATPVTATLVPSANPQPVTASATSGYRDDDHDEDEHDEADDHDEYEGAEDDD
ncbi:MAG: hypothetical protein ACSLFO_12440 [Acidimicrobiales bacterium]